MMQTLSIALAQINVTVGDIRGNVARIVEVTQAMAAQGADLVVFPEMAITGYPPEDLVFKSAFQNRAMEAVAKIAELTKASGAAVLVGGLWREGDALYNACFLLDGGECVFRHYKRSLPNYGVFDEKRLFAKGGATQAVEWRGILLGILICEDVWDDRWAMQLAQQGAQMLIVINASPYEVGKQQRRSELAARVTKQTSVPMMYLNLVGGQDELVFDGNSFAVNALGERVASLQAFEEHQALLLWEKQAQGWQCMDAPAVFTLPEIETIYTAMVLGLRDYVNKNGFKGVVIGISGGIDSGLTAAVAVDALGIDRVRGILMPSMYTSQESIDDAIELANNLDIALDTISIVAGMQVFDSMLADVFAGLPSDTTEENIQARLRGNILMAVSNKLGFMVLTTGNKSEMSVGYATLYGDMCGGYSVLKDVYKTTVYRLSEWRNAYAGGRALLAGKAAAIIPHRMITKAPSAELKPNQTDQDTLPAYEVLDAILRGLIEEKLSMIDLIAQGFEVETVARVGKMIYTAEYKRRQSPPGVKVSGMSFGRDRRYPITNKWIWQSQES